MRKSGYYWAYALSLDNIPINDWVVVLYNKGVDKYKYYNNNWYKEYCFREVDAEMIVHLTANDRKKQQLMFIDAACELNQEMYKKHGEICDQFYYMTNGYTDIFGFGDKTLWDSENDERVWIEENDDYENFKSFITNIFNVWIKSLNKLKL